MKYLTGNYFPKNPKKYKGDPTRIVYRSSWERTVFVKLDTWDNVLQWSSEEIVIPYRSPIDEKIHRYYPDGWVKMKTKDDKIITMILEIKPFAQTQVPKKKSRVTKKYIQDLVTYGVNQAKFNAAKAYCEDRDWKFQVLTEFDIYPKKKS
jgi:hypothetical protein